MLDKKYNDQIELGRKQKDDFFKEHFQSPIPQEEIFLKSIFNHQFRKKREMFSQNLITLK